MHRCAPVPRARTASRRPSHSGVPPSRRRQSRHRVRAGPACATHTPRPALALSLLSRCAVRHRAPPLWVCAVRGDTKKGSAARGLRARAPTYHASMLIWLPDVCELPAKRQRKKNVPTPAFGPAPAPTAPPHPAPVSSKGFKERKSTYRISAAPTGRGRCRRCRAVIAKGETRLEACAFVRPGRYTLLLRCTAPACINAPLSAAILSVYKSANRVPVDAALEGSAEVQRVVRAITFPLLNA